jgi:hypothetical protein
VHRIEQALERSQANGGRLEDEEAALNLQRLLSKTQNLLPSRTFSSDPMPGVQAQDDSPQSHGHISNYSQGHLNSSLSGAGMTVQEGPDDGYALEDAENPLQLLARASDLPISPRNMPPPPGPMTPAIASTQAQRSRGETDKNQDLRNFFGPLSPNLDVGEDIDPIDMGFITQSETDVLFSL